MYSIFRGRYNHETDRTYHTSSLPKDYPAALYNKPFCENSKCKLTTVHSCYNIYNVQHFNNSQFDYFTYNGLFIKLSIELIQQWRITCQLSLILQEWSPQFVLPKLIVFLHNNKTLMNGTYNVIKLQGFFNTWLILHHQNLHSKYQLFLSPSSSY